MMNHYAKRHALWLLFVLILPGLGCTRAHATPAVSQPRLDPSPPADAEQGPAAQQRVVRFDFLLRTAEPGQAEVTSRYTLNLAEHEGGELAVGTNVPLSPDTHARIDVGLRIRCRFATVGDHLLLTTQTELSATEGRAAIRKLSSSGNVLVATDQPVLVASFEDPVNQRRYEIEVVGKRLL